MTNQEMEELFQANAHNIIMKECEKTWELLFATSDGETGFYKFRMGNYYLSIWSNNGSLTNFEICKVV